MTPGAEEFWRLFTPRLVSAGLIRSGQPMLTVKDDYEDHAAAIRSPKECQFFKEYDAYTGFLALQDHFNSRNLR